MKSSTSVATLIVGKTVSTPMCTAKKSALLEVIGSSSCSFLARCWGGIYGIYRVRSCPSCTAFSSVSSLSLRYLSLSLESFVPQTRRSLISKSLKSPNSQPAVRFFSEVTKWSNCWPSDWEYEKNWYRRNVMFFRGLL